jgi:hypothetical protein
MKNTLLGLVNVMAFNVSNRLGSIIKGVWDNLTTRQSQEGQGLAPGQAQAQAEAGGTGAPAGCRAACAAGAAAAAGGGLDVAPAGCPGGGALAPR